jgi:hypothetical protein
MFPVTEPSLARPEFLAVRAWLSVHWASRTDFPGIAWWPLEAGSRFPVKADWISAFAWKWKA